MVRKHTFEFTCFWEGAFICRCTLASSFFPSLPYPCLSPVGVTCWLFHGFSQPGTALTFLWSWFSASPFSLGLSRNKSFYKHIVTSCLPPFAQFLVFVSLRCHSLVLTAGSLSLSVPVSGWNMPFLLYFWLNSQHLTTLGNSPLGFSVMHNLSSRQQGGILLHWSLTEYVPNWIKQQERCHQVWMLLWWWPRLGAELWGLSLPRHCGLQEALPSWPRIHIQWSRYFSLNDLLEYAKLNDKL